MANSTKPLCNLQHGFIIKGRSTVLNLLCAENEIVSALNSKEPYDITFDFSRAFDSVLHHLLLEELVSHDITGSAFRLVHSFIIVSYSDV